MHSDSVSTWLTQLKAGDHAAAQPLWERYFGRLVDLAHHKLRHSPRRFADEEDIALSAFASFCRGVGCGRFPQLNDHNDLWRVLVVITARKAVDLIESEGRQKRGGPDRNGQREPQTTEEDVLDQVIGAEPTPAFAAQVAEECQRLLDRLTEPDLRAVAVLKMEGHSNEEIATQLRCVARTVERKLHIIRSLWSEPRDT